VHLRGEAGGIARDHADRLAAVDDILENLSADSASWRGDDNHDASTILGILLLYYQMIRRVDGSRVSV